ncbi:MAG: hypothetical protein KDC05_08915, partial [Bacteroidales bacterium]|nr:hypothetical protein [Bacteroidales bacterium]
DDEDNNLHLSTTEALTLKVDSVNPAMNIQKIYLDAYQQETNSSGDPVYPQVNTEITEAINQGVLMMVYTGHGGAEQLAFESVMTAADLGNLDNEFHYPVILNASGEVNRYDDPAVFSLGAQMLFADNKGFAGVLSPSRVGYALANFNFSKKAIGLLVANDNKRMGDILREVKSASGEISTVKKFTYFGDPSMKPAFPHNFVETETINGVQAELFADTLNPGEEIVITGNITDENGNIMTGFSGQL